MKNQKDLGYFFDEHTTGTTIEFLHFDDYEGAINYKREAETNLLHKLIHKLGFDILREKKGLIYDLSASISMSYSASNAVDGINFVTENKKIKEMLEAIDKLIYKDLEHFIKSEDGTRWLEHVLSKFIYPTTISYNSDLANSIATTYFETGELYNYNKYVEEAKKITKERIIELIHEFQNIPPHIWVESNLPKKEVEKVVKESTLWKRFK
jgi:predicted Zn-dependent peptidase